VTRGAAIALVVTVTMVVAAAGARPYAGSWNDGSRLAAVEARVDGDGWTIDRSIYVDPASTPPGAPPPYPPSNRLLSERGTLDRLFIDGRFVSDKTPLSSVLLGAEYWMLQRTTGLVAREQAAAFARWMTMISAGVSFSAAATGLFVVAERVLSSVPLALGVTASFALATIAPIYAQHVNAHEMVLAVFAWLMVAADGAQRSAAGRGRALIVGTLCGLAWAFDAALGPIATAASAVLLWRRSRSSVGWVVIGAAPWIAAQLALNWQIGHTLAAPNSVPEYLAWPGSPFSADTMTGRYSHRSIGRALAYCLDLLFGRRGFFTHNLPLLLLPLAAWRLTRLRRVLPEWPVVVFALTLSAASWLAYGVLSTNRSGEALSIRWFVPLLAPLFYVVAVDLRGVVNDRRTFALLSVVGVALIVAAWPGGPWQPRVPLFWLWLVLGVAAVLGGEWARRRGEGR
jgi:hypothetical protein